MLTTRKDKIKIEDIIDEYISKIQTRRILCITGNKVRFLQSGGDILLFWLLSFPIYNKVNIISILVSYIALFIVYFISFYNVTLLSKRNDSMEQLIIIFKKYYIDYTNNELLDEFKEYILKYKIKSSMLYWTNSMLDNMNSKVLGMSFGLAIITNIKECVELINEAKTVNQYRLFTSIICFVIVCSIFAHIILSFIPLFDKSYKYRKMMQDIDKIRIKNLS